MPDWSQPDFQWDDANIGHIMERHGLYPEAGEQVFYNRAHMRRDGSNYHAHGQTDDGVYLHVICELRNDVVRVITAREMTRRERKFYARRR